MSSRRSSISFIESEQITPRHNYCTRFSEKYKKKFKPLKFEGIEEEHSINDSILTLDDSREFSCDFLKENNLSAVEKKIVTCGYTMDRSCRPVRNRFEGSWKIFAFGAVGLILYGILSHVQGDLKRVIKEVTQVKSKVRDIQDSRLDLEYKMSKLDNALNDMKYGQAMLTDKIRNMIDEGIDKIYADKTGRTDFALESAGGRIIQISPGTQNYGDQMNSIFGLSLCEGSHGPRAMIQSWTSPGTCWAMKGSSGGAIIKLLGNVKIDSVSLEHIPKSISPSGDSNTAPRDFAVWGMSGLADRGVLLGQWSYDIKGKPVQTFNLDRPSPTAFDHVEFKVMSNHGHPEYTCVYRFRVHGALDQKQKY